MKHWIGLAALFLSGCQGAVVSSGIEEQEPVPYSFRVLASDGNIPPVNWRHDLPEWISNPYHVDWARERSIYGWFAIVPNDAEQYSNELEEIQQFRDDYKAENTRNFVWDVEIDDDSPPLNWRDVVPDWIEDPHIVDWSHYRLIHGWILNLGLDE